MFLTLHPSLALLLTIEIFVCCFLVHCLEQHCFLCTYASNDIFIKTCLLATILPYKLEDYYY